MTVIVILALVALFIGLRLYSVLGERTGHEQQPILKPADPEALVEPCILAGSRPGDTVLDPFVGSGTTCRVAERYGLNAIGIDAIPWLTSPNWTMPSLILLSTWTIGPTVVIFLAGLQTVVDTGQKLENLGAFAQPLPGLSTSVGAALDISQILDTGLRAPVAAYLAGTEDTTTGVAQAVEARPESIGSVQVTDTPDEISFALTFHGSSTKTGLSLDPGVGLPVNALLDPLARPFRFCQRNVRPRVKPEVG